MRLELQENKNQKFPIDEGGNLPHGIPPKKFSKQWNQKSLKKLVINFLNVHQMLIHFDQTVRYFYSTHIY